MSEKLIQWAIRDTDEWLTREKTELRRQLKTFKKRREAQYANIKRNAECVTKLKGASFQPHESTWTLRYGTQLKIEVSDLPRIFKAIGPVRIHHKEVKDEGKNLVNCIVHSVTYPDFTFSYTKKIKPGGRCKIVTETSREAKVVCNV